MSLEICGDSKGHVCSKVMHDIPERDAYKQHFNNVAPRMFLCILFCIYYS